MRGSQPGRASTIKLPTGEHMFFRSGLELHGDIRVDFYDSLPEISYSRLRSGEEIQEAEEELIEELGSRLRPLRGHRLVRASSLTQMSTSICGADSRPEPVVSVVGIPSG